MDHQNLHQRNGFRRIDLRLLNWIYVLAGLVGLYTLARNHGIVVAKTLYCVSVVIAIYSTAFYCVTLYRVCFITVAWWNCARHSVAFWARQPESPTLMHSVSWQKIRIKRTKKIKELCCLVNKCINSVSTHSQCAGVRRCKPAVWGSVQWNQAELRGQAGYMLVDDRCAGHCVFGRCDRCRTSRPAYCRYATQLATALRNVSYFRLAAHFCNLYRSGGGSKKSSQPLSRI